jgi:hypothetical protein
MSFLLKDTIHRSLVESVYNEFLSRRANYYYFIGNILEWAVPATPETPEVTKGYEDYTRNGILSIKRINLRDVSFVIPRIDWETGTVYDQYDGNYSATDTAESGATSLKAAQFYVLTSTFAVYKCIFNNNGAASTVEPSGQDVTTLTTADGYIWKYMYTIPLSAQNRFVTASFMPVQRAVTNAFYSRGEVSSITIDSNGSGYTGNALVSLSVLGEFTGGSGNSIANIRPVFNTSGEFIKVLIDDIGAKYKSANIRINNSGFSGHSEFNNISNVSIYSTGAGYFTNVRNNTTVTITTTGASQPTGNAFASLVYGGTSNSIVAVNLTNKGYGYSPAARSNTTISIATTGNSQPTSNATANLNFSSGALLTPVLVNGQLERVLIEDGGVNYSSNLNTTISLIGDGTGAVLTPFINAAGQVEDVIIEERGNGYTHLEITFASATGSGANAFANLSADDLDTLQTVVELSAIDGGIHAFRIANVGSGYSYANVVVTGDGSGFAGNVVLANNTISYITVQSPGVGYTFANVTITGNGANANVSAIISPTGGHGSDPVKELFADTLMFTSTINNEKNHGILVQNDYRQFGIIRDIDKFTNDQAYANVTGSACYLVTTDTVTGLARDDILTITINGAKRSYEVVEIVSSSKQLLLQDKNNYALLVGSILTDETSNLNYVVTVINKTPDINKFSGDLLFIDNRTAVSYSEQQLVTLRTVLKL